MRSSEPFVRSVQPYQFYAPMSVERLLKRVERFNWRWIAYNADGMPVEKLKRFLFRWTCLWNSRQFRPPPFAGFSKSS